jgi:phenylacetate-CoA ligase
MKFNLFKSLLALQGFPIVESIIKLRELKDKVAIDFTRYVENSKWDQFHFHVSNNSFYGNFIGNKTIKEWTEIPILSKKMIQRPINELLSNGYEMKDVFKNNTSGSSGTPFFFAKDKEAHAKTWALILDRYSWHGIEYGKSLQARFYGIPLSGMKYYKEKIKDFIACRERFPVFDLSDEKLEIFIERFRKKRFEYLNGYTSSLVYFANYLIEKGIVLKDICSTLKVCFPTSEMCSSGDRAILEKGFGVKVVNEYGCAEVDVLAFENQEFEWIMSNENVYFEVVDDYGNILPYGESGRLIITSLTNKAMPFIRYEIGDIARISNSHSNNQILLELIGRTNEFAIMPSGKKVPALTFYYITKTMVQAEYGIKEFVIKQISLHDFVFDYVAQDSLSIQACNKIQQAMDRYLEPGLKAHFNKLHSIERTKAGKLKQFSCLINN